MILTVYGADERLPPHEHEAAHLCLMLGGSFKQEARGEERSLGRGELGLYPAGDRHQNRVGARGAVCLNIDLTAGSAPDRFKTVAVDVSLRLSAARVAQAIAIDAALDPLDIENLAAELAAAGEDDARSVDVPMRRVLDALDADPQLSLGELASHVGRHPTHLARAFRRTSGLTIGDYRRQRRLQKLCVDLRTGSWSLSELAHRHGYSDQAHMSREVKAFTGRSPGDWRRR